MNARREFYEEMILRMQDQDLDVAMVATAHCMAVIAAAHADMSRPEAIRFVKDVLLPLAEKILSIMDLEDTGIGRRLQ